MELMLDIPRQPTRVRLTPATGDPVEDFNSLRYRQVYGGPQPHECAWDRISLFAERPIRVQVAPGAIPGGIGQPAKLFDIGPGATTFYVITGTSIKVTPIFQGSGAGFEVNMQATASNVYSSTNQVLTLTGDLGVGERATIAAPPQNAVNWTTFFNAAAQSELEVSIDGITVLDLAPATANVDGYGPIPARAAIEVINTGNRLRFAVQFWTSV